MKIKRCNLTLPDELHRTIKEESKDESINSMMIKLFKIGLYILKKDREGYEIVLKKEGETDHRVKFIGFTLLILLSKIKEVSNYGMADRITKTKYK